MHLRDSSEREKISQAGESEHAYSNRPVLPEPGLSADIASITLMVVKLAIQFLLAGQETTLRSLDEDLAANWYLYYNRREAGEESGRFPPLSQGGDGMTILRGYPAPMSRREDCLCCGDVQPAAGSFEATVRPAR
jgi:hypothetical protein